MSNDEIRGRLKQLKAEEFVWIVYIGIIILSFYSNSLERKYFITGDLNSKKKYQDLTVLIFVILVFVYIYFLKDSLDDLRKLSPSDSDKKKRLVFLSFLGSLLIAIGGFIYLYIAIKDENIDVELAFN